MSESEQGPETGQDHPEMGDMPAARIEPPEPNPGGADALPAGPEDELVPADLAVEKNPAVDTTSTPALTEGEDTSTKATRDEPTDDTAEDPA